MKKIILLIVLIAAMATAHAQDTGTVIFARKKMALGVLGDLNYFIDGKLVCLVGNNELIEQQLSVGKHSFSIQYSGKSKKENGSAIDIEVKAGQTYTLKATIEKTNFSSKLLIEEVTATTWQRLKEGLKQSDCN